MKAMTIFGILLLVVGILAFSSHGLTYLKHEKVLDIGPIEAHREVRKTIPFSPLIGGLALAGGAVLIALSMKKA